MISAPRKPLWRWEPAPYLLLIVLLIATSVVGPRLPALYWVLFAVTSVVAASLLVMIVMGIARGPGNPDSAGILSSLDGLELVEFPAADAPPTPVVGTRRHQAALDAVHARGISSPPAVLVPDATRWLARRIRIAVHLVADEHVYHVGFLPEAATVRYNSGLHELAAQRRYVRAPSSMIGKPGSYGVELALGGLPELVG